MIARELFEVYAPPDADWTPWAKPVLFAHAPKLLPITPDSAINDFDDVDLSWAPDPRDRSAIIVDMPGASSVDLGVALAEVGYRPVPLYNTSPGPEAAVDAYQVLRALVRHRQRMASIRLAPNAPPAFLLDSARLAPTTLVSPGMYDNRWLVFPQDFPSANRMRHAEVHRVVLVQREARQPLQDLAHVLYRWTKAGITFVGCGLVTGETIEPLEIRKPSRFGYLWYRALVTFGLRRNSAGGFGSIVPIPSQSSGAGFG